MFLTNKNNATTPEFIVQVTVIENFSPVASYRKVRRYFSANSILVLYEVTYSMKLFYGICFTIYRANNATCCYTAIWCRFLRQKTLFPRHENDRRWHAKHCVSRGNSILLFAQERSAPVYLFLRVPTAVTDINSVLFRPTHSLSRRCCLDRPSDRRPLSNLPREPRKEDPALHKMRFVHFIHRHEPT